MIISLNTNLTHLESTAKRSDLVRLPRDIDTALFGGWGVRI